MDEILTAAVFAPLIGKHLSARGHGAVLTLVSVNEKPAHAGANLLRTPFTLIFTGPPGAVLPEGLHDVTFADGPALRLYLIPVHTPARYRQDYQAVFN